MANRRGLLWAVCRCAGWKTCPITACRRPKPPARCWKGRCALRAVPPLYVDISRKDLDMPVVAPWSPGLELTADFDRFSSALAPAGPLHGPLAEVGKSGPPWACGKKLFPPCAPTFPKKRHTGGTATGLWDARSRRVFFEKRGKRMAAAILWPWLQKKDASASFLWPDKSFGRKEARGGKGGPFSKRSPFPLAQISLPARRASDALGRRCSAVPFFQPVQETLQLGEGLVWRGQAA